MRYFNKPICWVANWNNFIFSSVYFLVFCLNLVVDISHCYNSILFNNFVFVNANFLNLFDNLTLFHYLFLYSWYLDYLLLNADNVHYLFNKFIDNIIASYDNWFFCCNLDKFRNFYSLLYYLLDLVNFWHFIIHLNYFIVVHWNLYYPLFNSSSNYRLFLTDLNFFDFLRNIRNNFLNLFYFFLNYTFLFHSWNFLDFSHLFYAFNYFFNLFWNFLDFLDFLLNDN